MKRIQILSIMAIATVFASCQKDDVRPGGNTNRIGIANVIVDKTAISRSSEAITRELPPIEIDGNVFTITETITPIEGAQSRANEKTLEDLKAGFNIYGFIDYGASKQGTQFMTDIVKHDGSNWLMVGEHNWRETINHHFWGHYGNSANLTFHDQSNNKNSIKFTYESLGEDDLMLAHCEQYSPDEEDPQAKYNIESLPFTHALANIEVVNNIKFKEYTDDNKTAKQDANSRAEVIRVYLKVNNKGECTATHLGSAATEGNGYTYEWSNLSSTLKPTDSGYAIYHPTDKTVGFVIPQAKGTQRTLTVHFIDKEALDKGGAESALKTPEVTVNLGEGSWVAGYKYTYTLSGTFVLPYQDGAIDVSDTLQGKGFQRVQIGTLNNMKYIKKFTIYWTGVPKTSGNGTYSGVSVEPLGIDPKTDIEEEYHTYTTNQIDDKIPWNPHYAHLGWSYAAFKDQGLMKTTPQKGTCDNQYNCSATFDLKDLKLLDGPVTIWLVYNGGSNGGKTGWKLSNVRIVIDEYQ